MKKTIVLGASTKKERYSNIATRRLQSYGHEVIPIGNREGQINDLSIETERIEVSDVDTVTLYLNPLRQKDYYDYILGLNPKRIIFNPGTENTELINLAKEQGVETILACTLVMLSNGDY